MTKDDRLFAPFPIEMDEHPKIIGLSDAAFRAIFEATFYSRRMLSDGFLDERVVLKRWGQEVADELGANDTERPSWIRVERGWQIHDFAKHHPLRAEIEEKRRAVSEKRSRAGANGAAKRWQPDGKPIAKNGSQSETESETETETELTTYVSESSPAHEANAVDPTKNPLAQSLKHGYAIDAVKVQAHITAKAGRDISLNSACGIALNILGKAQGEVKSPQAYVLGSITRSWAEIQQFIDNEGTQ